MSEESAVKYPANVLSALDTGCLLDLRARLAVGFIKGGIAFPTEGVIATGTPAEALAAYALDVAEAFMAFSVERGWVEALPAHGEINQTIRDHIARGVQAQGYEAECRARVSRTMGGGVAVPAYSQ